MSSIFKDRLVLVAGGGHFGTEAIKSLKESSSRVILVDSLLDCKASGFANEKVNGADIDKALRVKSDNVIFFVCDAMEFLTDFINKATPDFIVPAIYGHLAGEVVKRWLEEEGYKIKNEEDRKM